MKEDDNSWCLLHCGEEGGTFLRLAVSFTGTLGCSRGRERDIEESDSEGKERERGRKRTRVRQRTWEEGGKEKLEKCETQTDWGER